jgi:hypothetical protein
VVDGLGVSDEVFDDPEDDEEPDDDPDPDDEEPDEPDPDSLEDDPFAESPLPEDDSRPPDEASPPRPDESPPSDESLPLPLPLSPEAALAAARVLLDAPRSFFAQPDPLKWIAGAANCLRIDPSAPQLGQNWGPGSLIPWRMSAR